MKLEVGDSCPSCAYLGEAEGDEERIWGLEGALGRIHCQHCKADFCPDCWGKCPGCKREDSSTAPAREARAIICGRRKNCGYRCCEFCSTKSAAGKVAGETDAVITADDPRDFTIRELQTKLPWTIHYHRDFRASPMAHKDFAHGLLHVQKACGKLAAVVNDAEHKGSEFTPDEVDCYVADLVVCALRMANTCPGRTIDLQKAVVDRIEGKNGVTLER